MNLPILYTFKFQAMGGANEIQIYHEESSSAEDAVKEIINDIKTIEEKYSRYKEDSIITRINNAAGTESIAVDEETAALIEYAAACYLESGGLFDITSGILRKVWDFKAKKIPDQEDIDNILPLIGWDKVIWNKPNFLLSKKNMQIDFGGIGKEFAVDRAAGLLMAAGIKHALVNLAGDIRVIGPHPDGKAWSIGIQDPRKSNSVITSIQVKQGAVTTSGDYERFIEYDSKRYCHILNPKTGWPVQSFQSVTLIAESCLVAGSICTIAMLKGEVEGLKFLKNSRRKFLAIKQDGDIVENSK